MGYVSLLGVTKSFGAVDVLKGIDLEIEKGELVVFVGPSGCGKSTLLRIIAGLETITSGSLEIAGTVANDIRASKREIAMVFQSYALYPHMTVRQNMAFGLRMAKMQRTEIERRVDTAAVALHLGDYLDRYPRELSGGQRQRVAIGRAITRNPKVFLFDEPLSNLDAALRGAMRIEIADLHGRLAGSTMIYVTHDQVEAMTLADKIVVMNKGRIEQVGAPMELYNRPANVFVAQFIGSPSMNLLQATIEGDRLTLADSRSRACPAALKASKTCRIGVRPEDLQACAPEDALVYGVIEHVERLGDTTLTYVRGNAGKQPVIFKQSRDHVWETGESISLNARQHNLHFFDQNGERVVGCEEK